MADINNIISRIRREYPAAVSAGTFRSLFLLRANGADLIQTRNGPPVAVDVPRGSYIFQPTCEVVSAAEYATICARLSEMAPQPLSAAERKRNSLRARATDSHGRGRR